MRVLVVGAGIAGPTLAYWLRRTGHEPTIVERAPRLRSGGYLVDFWGTGFDVAERMGIVPRLEEDGYHVRELREVSRTGRRVSHLDPSRLIDELGGRYVTVARSDLSAAIYDAIDGGVETIFGDSVESIDDHGDRVTVGFERGGSRDFDLVVGADGLHSTVRALTFGPQTQFERSLGIAVAAFELPGYRPRDELVAVTHTEVGLQVLRVSIRNDTTLFCFTFRHDGELPLNDVGAQQDVLRERFANRGWEVPRILDRIGDAATFYLDRASQIRMPDWSRGRVVLIGDAAAAPSLLAGQGSALAMVEAYVLAAELHRFGSDHQSAFDAYHRRLSAVLVSKQDAAIGLGSAFAPRARWQVTARSAVVGLMGIPLVARLAMGRSLRDPIELPATPAS